MRNGDPKMLSLRNESLKRRPGTPAPFGNTLYDVYSLLSDGRLRGYMLYARTTCGYGQATASEKMYFAFEKYEKRGR